MKIRWTGRATGNLEGIFDTIARDSLDAAYRMMGRIRATVRRCADYPNSGRAGRIENTRESPVPGTAYVVVYRVLEKENTIQILAVVHGARNWPESF